MSQPRTRIVSVGEVMIEMARGSDGRFSQGCGGDTFNTAVYLARQSHEVAYATALGDDRYSDAIAALAAAEGVATDLILRIPNRLPGLYMIETDSAGERSFHYWRESSPARELFEFPEWNRIAESLLDARLIYFSGITLSIYSNAALGRFRAVPFRQAVAAEAGEVHQVDVLDVRPLAKMPDQPPERGRFKLGAGLVFHRIDVLPSDRLDIARVRRRRKSEAEIPDRMGYIRSPSHPVLSASQK